MPLLTASDPLPWRPRRIIVAGASGAGKSTLAARIAPMLGVEHVELDALFHGPNWTARETFEQDVLRFSSGAGWITEWQYRAVRELLADRADLLIWLDLSRRTVLHRVVRRTIRRRLGRQELWNGNVEPPLWTVFTDREHIVRWAWSTHSAIAPRVVAAGRRRPELPIVRLPDQAAVELWLTGPLHRATGLPPLLS